MSDQFFDANKIMGGDAFDFLRAAMDVNVPAPEYHKDAAAKFLVTLNFPEDQREKAAKRILATGRLTIRLSREDLPDLMTDS